MSPIALVKEATETGLGIIYKKEDQTKTVISYYAELTNDVIMEFMNLAKGIDKHIVLVDWTYENPEKCFNSYRDCPDYYIIFLGNVKKDSKLDRYPSGLTLDNGVKINEVFLLDKQFRSYPDDWDLFKSVSMVKCYDVSGIFYGDACQEHARLYADLLETPIFERKLIICKFNSWIIQKYMSFPSTKLVASTKMAKMFIHFLTTGQENTKLQLKDKITATQNDMTSHYTAIQRLEKNIAETNAVLRSFTRKFSGFNSEFSETKLIEIFDSFSKNKMYTKFVFHDVYFEGYTDEIWCESYGKKYYVGKFKVVVYLSGTVKLHNIDILKRRDDNDHPHISAGIPCLGNIKEIVPKMIYNGDFIGLLNLLHQFLTTYNESGPYIALEQGWGKPEDWCTKCEHPSLDCHCKTCGECGNDEEDCTCERCQRYGELMENVDCDACDYYKQEGEDTDGEPAGDYRCTY